MKTLYWILAAALLWSAPCFAQQIVVPPQVPPVTSPSVAASIVLKAYPGGLFGFQVNTGAVAVWVMLFNAATVPADGTVAPVKWYQVPQNSTFAVSYVPTQLQFSAGISLACSTTGPFTKTATATCTFSGEIQ